MKHISSIATYCREQPPPEQGVIPPLEADSPAAVVTEPSIPPTAQAMVEEDANNPTPTLINKAPGEATESSEKPQEAVEEQSTELPLVLSVSEVITAWWNSDKQLIDIPRTHVIPFAAASTRTVQEAPRSSCTPSHHKMIEVLGYDSDI